jgi:hypothetical protein
MDNENFQVGYLYNYGPGVGPNQVLGIKLNNVKNGALLGV